MGTTKSSGRDFDDKWARGEFEIVEKENIPIGALWLSDEGDHWRLREIFLLPEHQGGGLGSQLIEEVISQARTEQKPLRLRTLKQNRALQLYLRLGFHPIEEEGEKVWLQID